MSTEGSGKIQKVRIDNSKMVVSNLYLGTVYDSSIYFKRL